jgi:tetratricopeptide (TPR) repeat protein
LRQRIVFFLMLVLVGLQLVGCRLENDILSPEKKRTKALDLVNRGMALEKDGSFSRATDLYQHSIALSPRPVTYYHLGHCYAQLGDYQRAELYLGKALDMQSDFDLARYELQRVYLLRSGKKVDAIAPGMPTISDKTPSTSREPIMLVDDGSYHPAWTEDGKQPDALQEPEAISEAVETGKIKPLFVQPDRSIEPEPILERVTADNTASKPKARRNGKTPELQVEIPGDEPPKVAEAQEGGVTIDMTPTPTPIPESPTPTVETHSTITRKVGRIPTEPPTARVIASIPVATATPVANAVVAPPTEETEVSPTEAPEAVAQPVETPEVEVPVEPVATEAPLSTATPTATAAATDTPEPTETPEPTGTPTSAPPSRESIHEALFPETTDTVRLTPAEPEARKPITATQEERQIVLDTFPYHFEKGRSFLDIKEYDRAIPELNKALEMEPENLEARLALGDAYARKGRTQTALEQYDRAGEEHPNEPKVYCRVGLLYIDNRSAESQNKAREAYEKALAVDPAYRPALNNLGVIAMQAGKTDDAIGYFERVIKTDEKFADAHLNLGILYQDFKNDPMRAYYHYQRYVDLDGPRSDEVKKWIQEMQKK